jgi:mycothiol synthase
MSEVIIRPFGAQDMAPVVALWNRCLTKDPITEERFWQFFLLDPNFEADGALVAEKEGKVVGFLQAMYRKFPMGSLGLSPEMGWITIFFVAPEHRREGIASRLMDAGLDFLRSKGRTTVMCNGYAPYYIFPGIDVDYEEANALMAARGFTLLNEPVAMGMRLEGVRMPAKVHQRWEDLKAEGYEVRLFRREDTIPLLNMVEQYFPHWTPSIIDGLQHGNLETVVAFNKEGEVVGYTEWENTYTDPPKGAAGRFGPFGVRPDMRNKGIGAVIFYYLIERVTGMGHRYLWFGWAGGRNLSFYERAGCTVTRRFKFYKKAL